MGNESEEHKQSMYLRAANQEDVDLLFRWANDSMVRANAFSTAQIPYDNHVQWFASRLQDIDTYFYIFMNGNLPIGQIRLNVEGNKAVIDYSIAAEYRGHGYGKQMLQLLEVEVQQHIPQVKSLIAEVKKDNKASKQIFLTSDFREVFTTYEKKIDNKI